jgi:hypothetical protein
VEESCLGGADGANAGGERSRDHGEK